MVDDLTHDAVGSDSAVRDIRAPFVVVWRGLDASGAECVAWLCDERLGALVHDRCGPRRGGDPAPGARRIAAAPPTREGLTQTTATQ